MGQLNRDEIAQMGFASVGQNVTLSDRASFYNCARISIANHVRIDDYCVLAAGAGGITLGNYVHIAVGCVLVGAGKITMSDFSGLSSRVSIYSSSDDYSGTALTNPTVPEEFTNVFSADVLLGRHVIVGSGSVVLPGITIGAGAAVGALSLVTKDCSDFGIYTGNPARRLKGRKRDLLEMERLLLGQGNT